MSCSDRLHLLTRCLRMEQTIARLKAAPVSPRAITPTEVAAWKEQRRRGVTIEAIAAQAGRGVGTVGRYTRGWRDE